MARNIRLGCSECGSTWDWKKTCNDDLSVCSHIPICPKCGSGAVSIMNPEQVSDSEHDAMIARKKSIRERYFGTD